jgi:hypothetical protein
MLRGVSWCVVANVLQPMGSIFKGKQSYHISFHSPRIFETWVQCRLVFFVKSVTKEPVAYSGIFLEGKGGSTNSVEERAERTGIWER